MLIIHEGDGAEQLRETEQNKVFKQLFGAFFELFPGHFVSNSVQFEPNSHIFSVKIQTQIKYSSRNSTLPTFHIFQQFRKRIKNIEQTIFIPRYVVNLRHFFPKSCSPLKTAECGFANFFGVRCHKTVCFALFKGLTIYCAVLWASCHSFR